MSDIPGVPAPRQVPDRASRQVPDAVRVADPPDAGPVALVVVTDEHGRRHAYLEPSVGPRGRRRRLDGHQGAVVGDVQRLAAEAQLLEGKMRAAVHHARALGVSWALLGFSVGLTENGAKGRFGEPGEVLEGSWMAHG